VQCVVGPIPCHFCNIEATLVFCHALSTPFLLTSGIVDVTCALLLVCFIITSGPLQASFVGTWETQVLVGSLTNIWVSGISAVGQSQTTSSPFGGGLGLSASCAQVVQAFTWQDMSDEASHGVRPSCDTRPLTGWLEPCGAAHTLGARTHHPSCGQPAAQKPHTQNPPASTTRADYQRPCDPTRDRPAPWRAWRERLTARGSWTSPTRRGSGVAWRRACRASGTTTSCGSARAGCSSSTMTCQCGEGSTENKTKRCSAQAADRTMEGDCTPRSG
jgi:hypothetical protein